MPGSFLQVYLTKRDKRAAGSARRGAVPPVPEPGTLPMLLAGVAVLGWLSRRWAARTVKVLPRYTTGHWRADSRAVKRRAISPRAGAGARGAEMRKDRALLSEQQAKADLQWLMGSEPGRRVVWRLLDEAGIFRSGFSPDALTIAFNAGMRERGLRLLHDTLHHCPGDYALMFAEQQRRGSMEDKVIDAPAAQTAASAPAAAPAAAPARHPPLRLSRCCPAQAAQESRRPVPEAYEPFKVGDAELAAEDQAAVEALARELNLPQAAAQKLAERAPPSARPHRPRRSRPWPTPRRLGRSRRPMPRSAARSSPRTWPRRRRPCPRSTRRGSCAAARAIRLR